MNNRLALTEIAALLAEQTKKSPEETERFLREFVQVVSAGVYSDKVVKVKGLGTFKLIRVEERESISVNSGERFLIPSHYKFAFTPDKDLKELVNKPFSLFETTELNDSVSFDDLNASPDSPETEEASEESVEEILPETRIPVPTPTPEQPQVPEEIPAPPPSSNCKQWIGLAACLVILLIAGVGYICYMSGYSKSTQHYEKKLDSLSKTTPSSEEMTPSMEKNTASFPDSTPEKTQPTDTVPAPSEDIALTTIKAGDRLASIAQQYYGHKFFWVYIYQHNKQVIADPNNIPIGTEIRIPNPVLYGIDAHDRASIEKAAQLQSQILSQEF